MPLYICAVIVLKLSFAKCQMIGTFAMKQIVRHSEFGIIVFRTISDDKALDVSSSNINMYSAIGNKQKQSICGVLDEQHQWIL